MLFEFIRRDGNRGGVDRTGQLSFFSIEHGPACRAGLNGVLLLLAGARDQFVVPRHLQVDQSGADSHHPKSDESRNEERAANRNVWL